MAEHLQSVQWAVRPVVGAPGRETLSETLSIYTGDIALAEVMDAAKKLKRARAHGTDDAPSEYWKAILVTGSTAAGWAHDFCRSCWQQKTVPMTRELQRSLRKGSLQTAITIAPFRFCRSDINFSRKSCWLGSKQVALITVCGESNLASRMDMAQQTLFLSPDAPWSELGRLETVRLPCLL